MFGQDEIYEWWALPGAEAPIIAEADVYPSEARFIPIYEQEAGAIDAALVAESTGGFFDTIKSAITALSPLATSIIKATTAKTALATAATAPTIVTSPGGITAQPSTAGISGLLSSPLILGGIGLAAFMFLRGKGKGKRRR
jgi:hypothetical protein